MAIDNGMIDSADIDHRDWDAIVRQFGRNQELSDWAGDLPDLNSKDPYAPIGIAPEPGTAARERWERSRKAMPRIARAMRAAAKRADRATVAQQQERERAMTSAYVSGRLTDAGHAVYVCDDFADWCADVNSLISGGRKRFTEYAPSTLRKRIINVCDAIDDVGTRGDAIVTLVDRDGGDDLLNMTYLAREQARKCVDVVDGDTIYEIARTLVETWERVLVAPEPQPEIDERTQELDDIRAEMAALMDRLNDLDRFD